MNCTVGVLSRSKIYKQNVTFVPISRFSHICNLFPSQTLVSVEGEEKRSSPEELIHSTKPITHATAKAVAAAKSCKQEDMVVAANIGRKAVLDMIHKCRV